MVLEINMVVTFRVCVWRVLIERKPEGIFFNGGIVLLYFFSIVFLMQNGIT